MLDHMINTFVCHTLLVCTLLVPGNNLAGQQAEPAQHSNHGQRTPNQISPGLVPPGRQVHSPQQPLPSPVAPDWVGTLSQEHQQFIGQLLDYWQQSSQGVKQYVCDFTRYDYDTKFCNWRNPVDNRLAAASIMTGEIRFNSPDKASYETLHVYDFDGPGNEAGQDPKYKKRAESTNREKWICDGKAIFEFDYENKKLYETPIPLEMQGQGLVSSPIPFLFGASKDDILNRFWVRIITPEGVQDEYWLEAVPKKIDDSRNYKKVELVISRDEFLPVMLHLYAPNYNPKENNFTSRIFEFKNRKVNAAVNKIQNFLGMFVRPATPIGWELVKRNMLQPGNQQLQRAELERPAQRPGDRQIK